MTDEYIKCISLTIITEDRYQLWKVPIHITFTKIPKNGSKAVSLVPPVKTLHQLSPVRSLKSPFVVTYYRAVTTAVLPAMGYKYYFTTETEDLKSSKQIWNSHFLFILNEQQKLLFPTIYEVTVLWPTSNPHQKYSKEFHSSELQDRIVSMNRFVHKKQQFYKSWCFIIHLSWHSLFSS